MLCCGIGISFDSLISIGFLTTIYVKPRRNGSVRIFLFVISPPTRRISHVSKIIVDQRRILMRLCIALIDSLNFTESESWYVLALLFQQWKEYWRMWLVACMDPVAFMLQVLTP
jgi:hypothetical protein